MSTSVIKGIIIREVPYGEANKLLNILTKEKGIITVSARNARKPGRNMLLSTSVLTYGEFELYGTDTTRYYVNRANIIESFSNIREDVVLLTYSAHLSDIVLDAMRDEASAPEVFKLVLYTLNQLAKPNTNPDLIIHTFELKLLFVLGFTPLLNSCSVCEQPIISSNGKLIFSFDTCGVVCNKHKCISGACDQIFLSPATTQCLRYISQSNIEKIFSFQLAPEFAKELSSFSSRYICERLERNYTKLKMLEEFNL